MKHVEEGFDKSLVPSSTPFQTPLASIQARKNVCVFVVAFPQREAKEKDENTYLL